MRHRCVIQAVLALSVVAAEACREPPAAVLLGASELASPATIDSGEPFLSESADGVLMSWIGRSGSGVRNVRFARYDGAGWSEPRTVVEGERLLVNVSDFPSIRRGPEGALWAHWLERDGEGLGYGVRLSRSDDGGATWSGPWVPHTDATATDHGFVSLVPLEGGAAIIWLDGRSFVPSGDGAPPTMETALYSRSFGPEGPSGPEAPIDLRVCDCCQTDVATTADGPILVYRDRSPDEIRDVRVARLENGAWSVGGFVHRDGWETGACPINGPAIDARGDLAAVAWFTAAEGEARVSVAFSDDGGRRFDDPVRVDDGAPAGRVDVALLQDGSAVVTWVERTGGAGTEVRLRRVARRGRLLEAVSASAAYAERVLGFPRLALARHDAIIVAWTDGTEIIPRVRVTRITVEEP